MIGHATNTGGTWNVSATAALQAVAQEQPRQIDVAVELQVVQQLLNYQQIGLQIVTQAQQQQDNTKSNDQHGTTIQFQNNDQKTQSDGTVKIVVTTDTTKDTGTTKDAVTKDVVIDTFQQQITINTTTNPAPLFIGGPALTPGRRSFRRPAGRDQCDRAGCQRGRRLHRVLQHVADSRPRRRQ